MLLISVSRHSTANTLVKESMHCCKKKSANFLQPGMCLETDSIKVYSYKHVFNNFDIDLGGICNGVLVKVIYIYIYI